MPAVSPNISNPISSVALNSSNSLINAMLGGAKWGGISTGSNQTQQTTIYFSFPTATDSSFWSQSDAFGYGYSGDETEGFTTFNSTQIAAATSALQQWANVANINFELVNETTSAVGDIRFGNTTAGAMQPNNYAYTWSLSNISPGVASPDSGDIWLNTYQPVSSGNDYSVGAVGYHTILHEIGHALGIDHTFAEGAGDLGVPVQYDTYQYSVMSYSDAVNSLDDGFSGYYPTSLMLLDIQAIQHLYGANMSYNAGDNVYVFEQNSTYYQTIWDGGGNDTIQFNSDPNFPTITATINLNAGTFSQVGRLFTIGQPYPGGSYNAQGNNVAIAYGAVIENATGGRGSDTLIGNAVSNVLRGGAGNDTINGGAGNDLIFGDADADSMVGGDGSDIYYVDDIADKTIETNAAVAGGIDRVQSTVTYTLSNYIEELFLQGADNINATGNASNNIIRGTTGNNTLDGGAGADDLRGGFGDDTYIVDNAGDQIYDDSGNDTVIVKLTSGTFALANYIAANSVENVILFGNASINASGDNGNNVMTGNDGANILDGKAGNDTMRGGKGNDTYVIDNANDFIEENLSVALAGGVDLVKSSVDFILGAHLDNLTLTGTNAISGFGNTLANTIAGNETNNQLSGGANNDTLTGNAGNDTLNGDEGNDILQGGEGDDTLTGGAGIDALTGGKGNDTYYIDITRNNALATAVLALQDTVSELANPLNSTVEGIDTIVLTNLTGNAGVLGSAGAPIDNSNLTNVTTLTVNANVENFDASQIGTIKLNITGNGLANTIVGNTANNILDGAGGEDFLFGGFGDDTYVVDLKTIGLGATAQAVLQDYVEDGSDANVLNGGGIDTLKLRGSSILTNASYIELGSNLSNIDHIDASATGTTKLNLNGNSLNNTLTGNAAANRLEGRDGDDTLDGGAGADSMDGGNGDDTYYIDNVGDVITDSDGIDNAVIKLTSGTYVLAAGSAIENISIGNTAALNLTGNNAANKLTGNAAANILDGNGGVDILVGGDGADSYITDGDDTITETNALAAGGIDLVKSSAFSFTLGANLENLTLTGNARFGYGNALANTIIGNDANNELYGDAGKDTLKGGKGDDSYTVDLTKVGTGATATLALQDTIIENLNEGRDEIYLTNNYGGANNSALLASELSTITTFTLAANIENLYASSATDLRLNLTGNTLANQLVGNNTANILDGGAGRDVLLGGAGDDTYIVDLEAAYTQITHTSQGGELNINNLQDGVIENSGEGNDTLKIRGTFNNTSTLNLTAGSYYANVEGLDISLTGAAKINLTGDGENNNLVGNAAANTIDGGAGNDTLNGGAGADSLAGDSGNDTYVVDNIGDVVTETGADANDTIRSSIAINLNAPVSTTIPALKYANIENVTLTGAGALNLTGNAGANVLNGNDGANIIDGGVGFADEMNGGKGADTYIVNNVGDAVYEALNALQGGGIDLVKSKVTFDLEESLDPALINYLENLILTDGTANGGTANIDGAGNTLANILTGNAGNNLLEGEEGIDTLLGNAGNDTLDGGEGADKMTGGDGNDIYFVDDKADVVTETNAIKATGGNDTVNSEISYVLGANLENLTLIDNDDINGTGNTLANIITGNSGNNILDGGASAIIVDTLIGSDGSDTYVVDITTTGIGNATTFAIQDLVNEAGGVADVDTLKLRGAINYGTTFVQTLKVTDYAALGMEGIDVSLTGASRINLLGTTGDNNLVGNAFTNLITADAGDDTLNGGGGVDNLIGGAGNDTYVIDTLLDVINEESNNDTGDTVQSANLSLDLNNAKFNNIIENAGLLGTSALNLTGNNLANELTGNDGANILDGKGGADNMDGGKGNDTYIVGAGDVVEEEYTQLEGGGIDLVKASTTFVLSANIENLILTSVTLSSDGYGNALANILTGDTNHNTLFGEGGNDTLIGNAGNDNLIGGAGNDILNGGLGFDFYTFDTVLNALTNKDTIQGFNHTEDTIELSQAIFGGIGIGTLNAANYRIGAAATTADHRIINNAGNLYYDADGTGSTAAVQFATLTGTVGILGADDFIVF